MKNKDNLLVFVSTILVYAAGLSLVEDFTYPGFLAKHANYLLLSIPTALVIFIVIKLVHRTRFYSVAIFLGTAGLLFIYFVANAVEDFTYANYIFSHLHFNPQFLLLAVVLLAALFVINAGEKSRKLILGGVIIFLLAQYIVKDISDYKSRDPIFMLKNLGLGQKSRMELAVGKTFYDYTMFIEASTEPRSVILIPPQGFPWSQTGNIAYFRYFLYPRSLINGGEKAPIVDLDKVDYVLVDYGETEIFQYGFTHNWPKFNVPSEYILYWNPGDGSVTRQDVGEYTYKPENNDNRWGIIKVKK